MMSDSHWLNSERKTAPVSGTPDATGRPARSVPAPTTQDDPPKRKESATAQAVLPETLCRRNGKGEASMNIQTKSAVMLAVLQAAQRVATRSAMPILITGESGTGKTTLAAQIHTWTGRTGEFVTVECTSQDENLIGSALFGHSKGAYTGAVTNQDGAFKRADGGTVFLDEIGDLPLIAQGKLLRVVQDGTFSKVAETKSIKTNVRIIAATNKDLAAMVKAGTFREDLYYRLSRMELEMPPLRARREDVPQIVEVLLAGRELGEGVREVFEFGQWPGNIRQLETAVDNAYVHYWTKEKAIEELRRMGDAPTYHPTAAPVATPTEPVTSIDRKAVAAALSQGGRWWTSAEFVAAAGVSKPTACRIIKGWIASGEVEARGENRTASYRIANRISETVDTVAETVDTVAGGVK